jgi:hypothetical protein
MTAIEYFGIPVPRDVFRWWPLICIAAVQERWPSMFYALDDAQREVRLSDDDAVGDWPKTVFSTAAHRFTEYSLPHEALLCWAGALWGQMEAQH